MLNLTWKLTSEMKNKQTNKQKKTVTSVANHDDVIKWIYFLCQCSFVSGIQRSPVDSLTKVSDAQRRCFLWSAPEQTVEQTIKTPVVWDAMLLIMTSL